MVDRSNWKPYDWIALVVCAGLTALPFAVLVQVGLTDGEISDEGLKVWGGMVAGLAGFLGLYLKHAFDNETPGGG